MADWTDCPNGCGERVKATWCNCLGSWDGPEAQRPYVVPARGGYHMNHDCRGSFESGAAVLGGLIAMAEAIRRRRSYCTDCGAEEPEYDDEPFLCLRCA